MSTSCTDTEKHVIKFNFYITYLSQKFCLVLHISAQFTSNDRITCVPLEITTDSNRSDLLHIYKKRNMSRKLSWNHNSYIYISRERGRGIPIKINTIQLVRKCLSVMPKTQTKTVYMICNLIFCNHIGGMRLIDGLPYGVHVITHIRCNSTSNVITICHWLPQQSRSAVSYKSTETPYMHRRNTLYYPTEQFLWHLRSIRWVTYDSCGLWGSWTRDRFNAPMGQNDTFPARATKPTAPAVGYILSVLV